MGCGISSNSPVVTKRLAGRTSRVEDCSPQENTKQRADSSTSINSVNQTTSNYLTNTTNLTNNKSPTSNSPDFINSDQLNSIDPQNPQFNSLLAKNQRGITAVISKSLSNNKPISDQLEGESDRQTGKESVETNNSRNDSNYGSSYSAEMSKTPVSLN